MSGQVLPRIVDLIPFFFYDGLARPLRFGLLLAAATALDLWIADRLLFGRLARRADRSMRGLGLPALLGVAVLLLLLFPLKSVLLLQCGFTAFGLISLLWYDALIVGPWLGARTLLAARTGRAVAWSARVVALVLLAFLPIAAWSRFVEPLRVRTEHVAVAMPALRRGVEPIRIAVLADVQTDRITAYEHAVIERTLALRPDVILIPGDLHQGDETSFVRVLDDYRALLARLHAPGGVYFAEGDTDAKTAQRLLQGTGIRWLRDQAVQVTVRGRSLTIAGLDKALTPAARALVRELESRPGDDVRVVFCHYPHVIDLMRKDSRVDLAVAGHTHGGQVVLPFLGPPFVLSPVPRAVGAGGLHELAGRRVYVSRGVGMERAQAPRIRFLCPPEVSLLAIE